MTNAERSFFGAEWKLGLIKRSGRPANGLARKDRVHLGPELVEQRRTRGGLRRQQRLLLRSRGIGEPGGGTGKAGELTAEAHEGYGTSVQGFAPGQRLCKKRAEP